jgi:hypothetical protein
VTIRIRALILLLSALLCVAIVMTGGFVYNHYAIHYGTHGWGPPEVAFLLHYLLFGTGAAILLAAAFDAAIGRRLMTGFERLGSRSSRSAWTLAGLGAALVAGLITGARYTVLGDTAITDDETVYRFMARTFAGGRLYLPSMPEGVRPFFDHHFVVNDGKWYGIYFPGHPLALALGERLRLLDWVPTVSATLTVLLAFAVGRRVFGQRTALLAVALLAVSPFFILSSATLLAHSTAGVLLMAFVYCALRALDRPERLGWWLAAAATLGWAGLTRPVAAAAFALPWLVLLATTLGRRAGRRGWAGATLFCLAGAGAVGLLAAYQAVLSGDPLTTGYHTFGRLNRFSFTLGALVAPAPYPTLHELGYTIARLNFWLLGWPLSLAFLPFFRRSREGIALLAGPLAVIALYALTTVPSINVAGPVHYAELIAPLILVSASGLDELAHWARARLTAGAGRVLALPIGATLCALLLYLPLYLGSLSAMARVARAPYDLVEAARLDRAVIFVRSRGALEIAPRSWAYYPEMPSPGLDDPVLYVRDLGEERNRDLMRFLPDRSPHWMGMRDGQLVLLPLARP